MAKHEVTDFILNERGLGDGSFLGREGTVQLIAECPAAFQRRSAHHLVAHASGVTTRWWRPWKTAGEQGIV